MNVLHVGKFYHPLPGGIETHLRQLSAGLVERGHNVKCLVSSGSSKPGVSIIDGVHVKRIRTWRKGKPPCHPQLFLHIKRLEGDITHVHMPNPSAEIGALLANPKHLVVSYHADVIGRLREWYNPLQRLVLRKAQRIIVSSPAMMESRQLRPFKEKCVVIPYSIENTPHAARESPHPLYLCVGRLVPYKGFALAIKAMQYVKGTLWIIGQGPEYHKLARLTQETGVADRVAFFTNVTDKDLPSYFAAADVFLLPSVNRAEAFGIVQLEAMREGVPVVSTRLGTGTDWVNQDGKTGIVIAPNNVEELKSAMLSLQDAALRKRLGAGAKKRAAYFTCERMVKRVEEVYLQCLEQ